MTFGGQMDILDFVGGTAKAVDVLNIGKLHSGIVLGPIFSAGDKKLRPGRGQSGDVGVIGDMELAPVDGHPALAVATPEKMSGGHDHRDGYRHAVVNGGEKKGLRASTGSACYPAPLPGGLPPPEAPVTPTRFMSPSPSDSKKSRQRMLSQS